MGQRHAKAMLGVVAAVLLLSGGAYAVASVVVSLGPDVAHLPIHEVVETVTPLPLQPQAAALDSHRFSLYRSDISRSTDTADSLLKRLGIDDLAAAAFLRTDPKTQQGLLGRAGRSLKVEVDGANHLLVQAPRDRKKGKRLWLQTRDDPSHGLHAAGQRQHPKLIVRRH